MVDGHQESGSSHRILRLDFERSPCELLIMDNENPANRNASKCVPETDAILPALRDRVECLGARPGSRIGPLFFAEHVLVVERFVRRLAPLFGADIDVVVPAAILHDVAAMEDFSRVGEHHVLGAERAGEILRSHGFDAVRIARIQACIRRHVRPVSPDEGTPEEACLSHADAMAQMANPSYWLHYGREVRGMDFGNSRRWYLDHVLDRWSSMSESVKEIASPHCERAIGACLDDRLDRAAMRELPTCS